MSSWLLTFSAINFATTEESTPPDMATTTENNVNKWFCRMI